MPLCFEDAFMEAQASAVALCMEFLEDTDTPIDMVYVYVYTTGNSMFFNAFFQGGSRVYRNTDLFDREYVREFLNAGLEDAANIRRVCADYQRNCPYELKMRFNTHSRQFDADYRYDPLEEDESPTSRFMDWLKATENSLNACV